MNAHAAIRNPRRAAVLVLLLLPGCSSRYLNEHYGSQSGYSGSSVNGTSVFANMIERAGHRVRPTTGLYPRVEKADVIVWFPRDFGAPSVDAQVWFDDWLRYSEEPKTLVYVSRDYEAGPLYWREAGATAPANQQAEYTRERRQSESAFNSRRAAAPAGEESEDWFTLDRRSTRVQVKRLEGPWAAGVDPARAALEHRRFVTPAPIADPLLVDGQGHPLVSEIVYDASEFGEADNESRFAMIENGAFLLSGSLVNKERRKIAGRLVDYLGPPGLDVVFLESGADPLVLDSDPSDGPPTGLRLFAVWPIGATLAQLAALGVVFAMACWPIFGTPRRLPRESLTDFGRHVAAVGRLLAATRDRAYAVAQLRAYFQKESRD